MGCPSQTADRLMEQLSKGCEAPHHLSGLISETGVDQEGRDLNIQTVTC